MATKREQNRLLLEKATKKLGAEKVQSAISGAGLQKTAIKTLKEPVKPVVTEKVTAIKPSIEIEQKNIQELERQKLAQERGIEPQTEEVKKETPKIIDTKVKKEIKPEKPTIIKEEPVKKEEIKPVGLPQSIEEWKTQGSNMADLESMIETKYGTVVTSQNGVLTANIDGVNYQWNIDDAGNPIKTKSGGESVQDIFNQLIVGQTISDTGIKQTGEYETANRLYNKYKQYENLPVEQISALLNNGGLLPGTNLYEFLLKNPEVKVKIEKAKSLNQINNKSTDLIKSGENLTEEIVNEPTVSNYMDDNNISIEEFNNLVSTPESIAKGKEVEKLGLKVNELRSTYDDIRRSTEEELKGSGATRTAVESLIASRQADIRPALNLAIDNYNTVFGTYTDLKQTGIDLFKTNLGLHQAKQKTEAEKLALQEQRQFTKEQLQEKRDYEKANQGVKTTLITDKNTGQQQLINSQTGDVIKTYEPGVKPETAGTFKKFDENTLYNETTGQFKSIRTGTITDSQGNVDYSATDFSTNPKYNTLEASFKNNNPTGITWGVSNELKSMWDEAGVTYSLGSARPTAEGGNYVKFASVQDGLDAYTIALTQRGDDVEARLKKWVGVGNTQEYADDLMGKAGIEKGAKFSELSDEQIQELMSVQLQRESPKFYEALTEQAQVEAPTGGNKQNFAYADTLTASDRTKFLKSKGLENQYIQYKSEVAKGGDTSDVKDMTDITLPEKTTQFKAGSLGYGIRMNQSDKIIRDMEEKYKKSWTITEVLSPKGFLPNFLKSSDRQKYEQAQKNFINSVLRQESGATISDTEFDNAASQYFPKSGDSNEVIEQKRINRETVVENMYRNAGMDSKGRNILNIYKNVKGGKETKAPALNLDDLVKQYETTAGQTGKLDTATLSDKDLFNKYY